MDHNAPECTVSYSHPDVIQLTDEQSHTISGDSRYWVSMKTDHSALPYMNETSCPAPSTVEPDLTTEMLAFPSKSSRNQNCSDLPIAIP